MTTYEVAELFKQYVDDADATFMSQDDAVIFLNRGYNEFFSMVAENDSDFYVANAVYNNVNTKALNLATTPASLPLAATTFLPKAFSCTKLSFKKRTTPVK